MDKCRKIYRLYDDNEEKHYLSSTLEHSRLEQLAEEFRVKKEQIRARDFIEFVHVHDQDAAEVEVHDLYF